MIDEKGKLFGKLSIIDALVILVIIVAVLGCAYKFLGSDEVAVSKNDTFTTVLRIQGVKDFLVTSIHEGEAVYEKNGSKLGTITDISVEPYTDLSNDREGELLTYDNRNCIYITLSSTGTVNKKGFFADGNRQLFVGAGMSIQSRLFSSSGADVVSVSK